MIDLEKRISDLERVIRNVPSYIDNWKWAEENFDILKTIPGYHFPTIELGIRRMKEANK